MYNNVLSRVFDQLPVLVDAFDDDGHIVYWNAECERVTGYRADEIVGNPQALSLLYPDPSYLARKQAEPASRAETYRDWEWTLTIKSGQLRRIAWTTMRDLPSALENGAHAPWRWAMGVDVTERWQAMQAADERQALLTRLVEQIPEAVWLKDGGSGWQVANRVALDAFGLRDADWHGKNEHALAIEHPAIAQHLMACVDSDEAAWRHGSLYHGEEIVISPNGGVTYLSIDKVPVFDDAGQRKEMIVVARDTSAERQAERALLDTQAKLRFALSLNGVAMFDLHVPSGVSSVSPQYAEMLGYDPQTFVTSYALWLSRLHEGDKTHAVAAMQRCMDAGETITIDYRQRSASGDDVWISTSASVFERDASGQPLRLVGTHRDITATKKAHARIDLAAQIFDQSRDGITLTNLEGNIVYVNAAFSRITGYTFDEVQHQNPRIMSSGMHDASFYRALWDSVQQHGRWQGEIWNRRKTGEIFPEWLEISVVEDAAGKPVHYLAMFSDLSERKAVEEQIRVLTETDPVTRLPNRHMLQDRCLQAFALAQRTHERVALLLIDLDRFALVNESLGHATGDLLLREVALRLSALLRPGDTLARLGGDEFALLLTGDIDEATLVDCAQRLFGIGAQPVVINGEPIAFAFSIGIALSPGAGDDFAALMRHADSALTQAKQAGRNTWRLADVNLDQQVLARLRLDAGLRRAVAQHEFVLHYQPVIDLQSGHVIGAEALVRWQTPDQGLLPPGDFIAAAEESGQIEAIGAWVLLEACQQTQRWNAARTGLPPLRIAVNVAPRQLHRGLLEAQVQAALATSGLPPGLLELELTESALIQDAEHVLTTLIRIKKLGVRMSIDDFGTGYSSFAYLRRFQVDTLKIDQSFVRDLLTDPGAAAIVRAIIQMGGRLGLTILAEGVESAEIGTALQLIDCDLAQGYHYARPLTVDAFEHFADAQGNSSRQVELKTA